MSPIELCLWLEGSGYRDELLHIGGLWCVCVYIYIFFTIVGMPLCFNSELGSYKEPVEGTQQQCDVGEFGEADFKFAQDEVRASPWSECCLSCSLRAVPVFGHFLSPVPALAMFIAFHFLGSLVLCQ